MGHTFTPTQAKNKFKNLKKVYMKHKDSQRQTGAENQHFDYVDQFDDIFNKHHNVSPQIIAPTLAVPPIAIDTDESLSGLETDSEEKPKKTSKV